MSAKERDLEIEDDLAKGILCRRLGSLQELTCGSTKDVARIEG